MLPGRWQRPDVAARPCVALCTLAPVSSSRVGWRWLMASPIWEVLVGHRADGCCSEATCGNAVLKPRQAAEAARCTLRCMTWVLATAFGIFGSMIGDVRVCRLQGSQMVPYSTVGLRRVHVFSDRTVCGFAGQLTRAWAAPESLNTYMRANGYDEPPLNEQLQGWVDHVARTGDALAKPAEQQEARNPAR